MVWCGVVVSRSGVVCYDVEWYGGGVVALCGVGLRRCVMCGGVFWCDVWCGLEWYLAWSSMLSRASSAKSNSTSRARGRPDRV